MTSSVTCFKATAGAEADTAAGDIFDALGDSDIANIDMEPLDTSDLVSSNKKAEIFISVTRECVRGKKPWPLIFGALN